MQLWIDPSPRITWLLAGRTAISLDSMEEYMRERLHQDLDDKAFEGKSMAFTDKREACLTDNVQGNETSVWWTDWAWVSPASQDVGQRCDESCFMWRHCRWLRALGGVHRPCSTMVADESVYGSGSNF